MTASVWDEMKSITDMGKHFRAHKHGMSNGRLIATRLDFQPCLPFLYPSSVSEDIYEVVRRGTSCPSDCKAFVAQDPLMRVGPTEPREPPLTDLLTSQPASP